MGLRQIFVERVASLSLNLAILVTMVFAQRPQPKADIGFGGTALAPFPHFDRARIKTRRLRARLLF